jgi:hypothetical protein
VPVVISQVNDNWNQHWEGLVLIGFQNVQEVVVFKEAHCSISNLKMDSTDALDNSLEKLVDQMIDFVYFTDLQYLLQLSQEQSLFDAVGEWPVLKKSLQQWNGQSSVLGKEEHGASQELLVELRASLDLVEWDDDILEEDNVLVSKWDGESTDDTSKDVQKLSSTVKLVGFVNKGEKALVDGLSNHLSSWNKLGIKLMEDVFKVISLNRFF